MDNTVPNTSLVETSLSPVHKYSLSIGIGGSVILIGAALVVGGNRKSRIRSGLLIGAIGLLVTSSLVFVTSNPFKYSIKK
jgi:hypothetical protein